MAQEYVTLLQFGLYENADHVVASETVKERVTQLITTLPALQTLLLVVHGRLADLSKALHGQPPNQSFGVEDICAAQHFNGASSARIQTRTILLLDAPLCSVRGEASWVNDYEDNCITYRATPTSDPLSYEGLELTTEARGVFDYDAALQWERNC